MYFSDIVGQLEGGTWKINEKNQNIYEIIQFPLKIEFFTEKAKISCNKNEFDVCYSDFADFSFSDFTKKNEDGTSVPMSKLLFKGTELFVYKDEKMQTFKKLVNQLNELFDDNFECTPKAQVGHLIEEFALNENSGFNPALYKLLLMYRKRMEVACNNGFLQENSRIITLLEADSGKLSENFGETIKKGFMSGLKGGLSGLITKGIDIAKASGTRVVKGFVNDVTDTKAFLLLTDKNVIFSKQEETKDFDFDDAQDIFEARQDETLAGVVDIFDDCENLIVNNVAQTQWNVFKTNLRKIKKEENQLVIEDSSSVSDEDDEFAEAEKKITKLKKMLDAGLITQQDFDAKKADILASL